MLLLRLRTSNPRLLVMSNEVKIIIHMRMGVGTTGKGRSRDTSSPAT
jgi:hypothetical protein